MTSSLLDKARTVFSQDLYATDVTGIVLISVDVSADGRYGKVVCNLKLQEKHLNARGAVMGGVLFTLADYAFAVASNITCLLTGDTLQWVSLDSTIHYLSTTHGNTLTATTQCVKQGRSTCFYIIHLTDDSGLSVAQIETTGMKVAKDENHRL